jgi:hypothetical protein
MSPIEAILVFAGIPAAVTTVVFALVYGLSGRSGKDRYGPR